MLYHDCWVFYCTCTSQSLIDIVADEGWLVTTLKVMHLVQMCVQGRWLSVCSLFTLPHFDGTPNIFPQLNQSLDKLCKSNDRDDAHVQRVHSLAELITVCQSNPRFLANALGKCLSSTQLAQVNNYVVRKSISVPHFPLKLLSNLHVDLNTVYRFRKFCRSSQ